MDRVPLCEMSVVHVRDEHIEHDSGQHQQVEAGGKVQCSLNVLRKLAFRHNRLHEDGCWVLGALKAAAPHTFFMCNYIRDCNRDVETGKMDEEK